MKLAAFVFGAIPLLVQFYAKKYLEEDRAKALTELDGDFGIPRIQTYDFIVVGAGTAGCVVAGRLSEKFNVLLVEAGGTPVPQAHVPFNTRTIHVDPDINFIYHSVPQNNISLGNGGLVSFETGKMLGGSGSHNDMQHQRGSPSDYNNYASITNDPTWTYANVLQYFKKSEDFVGILFNPEQADYYGRGGPLTVDTHNPAILPKWFEAGRELGFEAADPNGFQIESFAPLEKLMIKGGRVSTYTGYIKPYEGVRANLTVVRYSEVSQILIDKSNRAYGVAYSRHGVPQIAHASKEVILSAGTILSPVILMISGVGPQNVLQEAQIPVKVNLPGVGENFADHALFPISSFKFNDSALPYLPRIPEDKFEEAITQYLNTGEGEFGQLQEGPQAFFVSARAKADGQTQWPDGRVVINAACPMPLSDEEEVQACFISEIGRPKSKGRVTLNATAYKEGVTDYQKLAVIDPNTFSDPTDVDVVVEGIQLIFRIMEETQTFKSMGARYTDTPLPACSAFVFRSVDYWKCYIRETGFSSLHMVGTCSMGNGPMAVTDSKLRVRGVSNLRVVDASVLPETPNANLNGPVILVAEKAADDIANSWV